MRIRSTSLAALRIASMALLLVLANSRIASAKVFHCPSGDVSCLIASVQSANEEPGSHTIRLDAGTYTLTATNNTIDGENALPSITRRLTIEGAGAVETIIESAAFNRILHISTTGNLTLRHVTIQRGLDEIGIGGGGILNRGVVTVSHAVIRDSFAFNGGGGIQNQGTLTVVDTVLTGNAAFFGFGGGNIQSGGHVRVLRSRTEFGGGFGCGGMLVSGAALIEKSTIESNIGEVFGGGICIGSGTATISNTTIATNGAGGGGAGLAVFDGASARLVNVTVADNHVFSTSLGSGGGGILTFSTATVQAQNTILARNTVQGIGVPALGPDCLGSVTSLGNNIIGDATDCTIDLLVTDLVGDAGLGVFTDDGTPGGGYIPLLAESPAIDAGNRAACPRTDQLGQRRVDGDADHRVRCDIGAVEFIPPI